MSTETCVRIAVLMACYNRRAVTLECLTHLFEQVIPEDVGFDVYLVDDASMDGTGDAVREQFPSVIVLQGDGALYWNGGMRKAWAKAMEGDYDYYLWLNDDSLLFPLALAGLLAAFREVCEEEGRPGVVVGSTRAKKSDSVTYGGVVRKEDGRNLDFVLVVPRNVVTPCDTFNGNIVLIPRAIAAMQGNLSETFTHSMGDYDYGLTASAHGIPLYVAPGYAGVCDKNDLPACFSPNVSLRDRWRILHSPKGLPPAEWAIFLQRHLGWKWRGYLLKLYGRVLLPRLWHVGRQWKRKAMC